MPVVVALNMIDEARRRGAAIDARAVARCSACPVRAVVGAQAARARGARGRGRRARSTSRRGRPARSRPVPGRAARTPTASRGAAGRLDATAAPAAQPPRAGAVGAARAWTQRRRADDVPAALRAAVAERARRRRRAATLDAEIIGARYAWLDAHVPALSRAGAHGAALTERIDAVLLHPRARASPIFLGVMAGAVPGAVHLGRAGDRRDRGRVRARSATGSRAAAAGRRRSRDFWSRA